MHCLNGGNQSVYVLDENMLTTEVEQMITTSNNWQPPDSIIGLNGECVFNYHIIFINNCVDLEFVGHD